MANRRVLVKRRKSIRNIRKITRTMELIATARFKKAMDRAAATKAYTEKLAELVADLAARRRRGRATRCSRSADEVQRAAAVVLTSNRGLCGGYNGNVAAHRRRAPRRPSARRASSRASTWSGKQGIAYFRFLRRDDGRARTDIDDKPRFDEVEPIANDLMDRFIAGKIDRLDVAYTKFVSAGVQRPVVGPLLPLSEQQDRKADEEGGGRPAGRSTSSCPAPSSPRRARAGVVQVRLFKCFLDAAVSEQIARMVAMKAATENAGDMIKALTLQYNRARQTQITSELLDIIGGVDALA